MYKKVYVEITNNCNLDCSFCNKNKRDKLFISTNSFNKLLTKLKSFTKYLYFHVMGEPTLHPNINELIDIASKDYFVNITTNGYLINRISNNKNIRQVNISLHSFDEKYNKTINEYLDNILSSVDKLLDNNTIINFRLWVNSKYKDIILNKINEYYHVSITGESFKIKDNLYYDVEKEFIWPDLNNDYYEEKGSCKGTIDHIGILADGTVVPCCLDSNGIINLGNIYKDNLDDIINSDRYQNMYQGFKQNKKCEELCKKCNFYSLRKE